MMRFAWLLVVACGTPAAVPTQTSASGEPAQPPSQPLAAPLGPAPLDSAPLSQPASPAAPAPIDAAVVGMSALALAAQMGKLDEIKALLASGANIDDGGQNQYGTPLLVALHFSRPDAAELLLDRGASIAGPIGKEALSLAARDGADAVLDKLLQRGVTVAGTFALHRAAKYGHASTIQKLLAAGAVVDEPERDDHDFTPLLIACMSNELDAVKALLAAKARVDLADNDGSTPLHWAVFGSRPEEMHIYHDFGEPHGTMRKPQKSAPIVELLVAHRANVNATDDDGDTPLHKAAMFDASASAKVLVAAGANKRARNRDRKTPHDLAKERKNSVEPIVRY